MLRNADILASGATVADDGEEITDCIVNCHSLTNGFSVGIEALVDYQEDLVTPGILPCVASSRNVRRERPNLPM